MRLVLDITTTCDGRYEGCLTGPGTGGRQDFAGILELLAILEERLGPGVHHDAQPVRSEAPPISARATDGSSPP